MSAMLIALAGVCLLLGALAASTLLRTRRPLLDIARWSQVEHPGNNEMPRALPGRLVQHLTSRSPVNPLSRRIVFLVNAGGFGGVIQHTLNLAEELQRRGLSVLLVAPTGAPMVDQARARGLPVRELNLGQNIGRGRGFLGTLAYLNPLGRRR